MTQIVGAYRERMLAVGTMSTNWTYVETYLVDAGSYTTNEWSGGTRDWTYGTWLGYDEPDTNGQYYVYDWPLGEFKWVDANVIYGYYPGDGYDILWGALAATNTYLLTTNIVVTNSYTNFLFGEFTTEIGGHSYTGHAQVTKGLLDMMWASLAAQLTVQSYGGHPGKWTPNGNRRWLIPEYAVDGAYYNSTNLMVDTHWDDSWYDSYTGIRFYYTDWTVKDLPYQLPQPQNPYTLSGQRSPWLSLAHIFNKHSLGRVGSLATNDLGVAVHGTVQYYEIPTNLAFDVHMAQVDYTVTNRVDISTNDIPVWSNQFGWASGVVNPPEPGLDRLRHFSEERTNSVTIAYYGTNDVTGLEVTISGLTYANEPYSVTNAATTNIVWNKDWENPVFSTIETPESVVTYTNITATTVTTETLAVEASSAFTWASITDVTASGTPGTNDVFSLAVVWPGVSTKSWCY